MEDRRGFQGFRPFLQPTLLLFITGGGRDKPVMVRPTETRMGSGKGSPDYWVAVVKLDRILYEMSGVAENIARMPISIAAHCNCRTAKAKKSKYGVDII
ncbi:hypothetical protein Godav_015519 [Gossypium davidsonii]|uniref:Ribosomal protein L10e/L16 domain-containing protein n=1 Tax=Gossypium davidsonii TaxID=34287 RepID=A0A7J8RP49_GOSDV|nr:hypothetical protein [Gossypium davidsonii]